MVSIIVLRSRVRNQWLENCNLASGIVNDAKTPYLCELHFEKIDFTSSKDLKAEAVPTLFGHIEGKSGCKLICLCRCIHVHICILYIYNFIEPLRKRSAEDVLENTVKKMSFKDKSLNKQIITPSESSSLQDDVSLF